MKTPAAALWIGIFLLVVGVARSAALEIASDEGRDDDAIRAAWRPMKGTASASHAEVQGRRAVRLPCNFAGTRFERASWDRAIAADLSSCRGVQFEFFSPDLAAVSQLSIYFQSGDGWYATTFDPAATNTWCTITVNKSSLRSEGRPAGWQRISTIRISAWRAADVDTEICVRNFRPVGVLGTDAKVAILRADSVAAANAAELRSVNQFTDTIAAGLDAFGIGYAIPSDMTVTGEQLRGAKLLVLPYNPSLPPAAVEGIRTFVGHGGRVLACYALPADLQPVLGITLGRLLKSAEQPRGFGGIRVKPDALPGAPALVRQRSWNIREARPARAEDGAVLAEWVDETGEPAGHAAIVATPTCVLLTHVLLNDDAANQRRLLLAMAGRLVPELWRDGAATAVARIGQIGGAGDFDAAAASIERQGSRNERARSTLAAARSARDQALALSAERRFPEALDAAATAKERMLEAFCLAQVSPAGEFRAFWCHNAFGVDGMDWDQALQRLAAAGFTAIFPNMLWGGVAFYPSEVLPVAADVASRGDQVAQCLAAARKYGLQVHVWKVNWNTGHRVPAGFVERMRAEGRLQMSSTGKSEPWLCPSHPDNRALEIASMVEVARNYDVDGLHFDYIRYPDADHCFCPGCRERFERAAGAPVAAWPRDCLAGGSRRAEWLEWRRSNITAVVRAVSEQARALKPRLKLSAAVFRNWATDRDTVGQDWKLWCERGWLDFVCPMDYTNSDRQFETWVRLQKDWAGRTPVYPGIGVSSSSSRLPADRTIGQIDIARRHGTGGFILFNYGAAESRELLSLLSLGTTASR